MESYEMAVYMMENGGSFAGGHLSDDDHRTAAFMLENGGSFASKLADAWLAADPENRATIQNAFADMWRGYSAAEKKDGMVNHAR